jgi:Ras-related GTP-binding protein A/B
MCFSQVDHSLVKFVGNLVLNLWDCGGQAHFIDGYLKTQREHIFRNVGVLIYVFDVQSAELEDDMQKFEMCIEAVSEFSDSCRVFCLIHKMDTIEVEEDREAKFQSHRERIMEVTSKNPIVENGGSVRCFRTSIWDETLYRAWSSIVYSLIPNIQMLEEQLTSFANICEADEVVLFEKKTFLVIVHATVREHCDAHRFEKISNFIKQFKLSCMKSSAKFSSLEVSAAFSNQISSVYLCAHCLVIGAKLTIYSIHRILHVKHIRHGGHVRPRD